MSLISNLLRTSRMSTVSRLSMAILLVLLLVTKQSSAELNSLEKFSVASIYKGLTHYPQFDGRDKNFKSYRTRIREALRKGPTFAGEFSVVHFGCGTGCSRAVIASNKTGEVFSFPRGGDENTSMQLSFTVASRLMYSQWYGEKTGVCNLEQLEWIGGVFKIVASKPIGKLEACFEDINLNIATAGSDRSHVDPSSRSAGRLPAFILTNRMLFRSTNPDQFVRIGEIVTLRDLGRRFPNSKVVTEFEMGDEEYEFYKITDGDAEVVVNFDEKSVVKGFSVSKSGTSDSKGTQVGDSVAGSLGSHAYCNTYREDSPDFCMENQSSDTVYEVEMSRSDCHLPELQQGIMSIPNCLRVIGILQN